MRGPIDYIVVGFEGNNFDGSILSALTDAIDKGIIRLVDFAIVMRDEEDNVTKVSVADTGNELVMGFAEQYMPQEKLINDDDVEEVADLIEKNCAAGLLVIEQLWAKPLKEVLINANGVLLAEGRIHPEAAEEIN
ncbi:hypothetical protein KC874_04435 [Candidatus Saccharibacteria bacterium]|nr:hypothetical protein [Candidatus Saccharibacteria bacterium]